MPSISQTQLKKLKVELSNPLSICWQITKTCNFSCPFCISGDWIDDRGELDYIQVKKILNKLFNAGIVRIDFTGGEPFLRKDFLKILKYAASLGFRLLVTSNGSIYSDKIAKCLKNNKILLQISLDGDEKTHDSFRGKNNFQRTLKNIKKYKRFGVDIRINFLVQRFNLNKINYIYNLAKKMKIKRILYIFIAPQGRADTNRKYCLSQKEISKNLTRIQKIKKNSKDILITIHDYNTNYHSCFLIDPYGNVISQGYSTNQCNKVGNILTQELCSFWNNKNFDQLKHFLQYAYMFEYYM